jgi:two-component system KDP operon response regulator KdpE
MVVCHEKGVLIVADSDALTDPTLRGQRILIIDDDPDLVSLLERAFAKEGAEVYTAADGREGLRQFRLRQPDLVVLDLIMPVLDGWQTRARLQQFPGVPIIFLSARTGEGDITRGLDSGAVDYVTKPFSIQVLLARARAALRRSALPPVEEEAACYDDGHLCIDPEARRVLVGGAPVRLSATEYRLLICLFQNAGRALTSRQILEEVWGWEYRESDQYVHAYLWRLRQKVEPDPSDPAYLVTERGVGYRFQRRSP